jgi:hypothetical protein
MRGRLLILFTVLGLGVVAVPLVASAQDNTAPSTVSSVPSTLPEGSAPSSVPDVLPVPGAVSGPDPAVNVPLSDPHGKRIQTFPPTDPGASAKVPECLDSSLCTGTP